MSERASAQIEIDHLRDELLKARTVATDIENARNVLRRNGFFVANLWTIADVTDQYKCSEKQAQEILKVALTNPSVMEHIFDAIKSACDEAGYEKIN